MRTLKYGVILALAALPAAAQNAGQLRNVPSMPSIAAALGVQCQYCHGGGMGMGRGVQAPTQAQGQTPLQPPQPPSHMTVARNMIAMVNELNENIMPSATGKDAAANTRIQCVTCHRGVAIPGQLSDIMTQTAFKAGGETAVTQYRELRKQYYGRQAYDFGEDTLVTAATALANSKPDAAVALLKLNLEFYPQSIPTYSQLAYAYTRTLDDDAAIAVLEKALEISPENSVLKGRLEQLRSYHRPR